jgi:hypothetical protein
MMIEANVSGAGRIGKIPARNLATQPGEPMALAFVLHLPSFI